MISRKTVLCLAISQLIAWGISYYLVGVFGGLIAADFGWSSEIVYGGFAAALLVMGLTSPVIGRLIDQNGGRQVMIAGALLNAVGCIGLALSAGLISYYAAWICLGLAMRLTLYDAAFATLAQIGGAQHAARSRKSPCSAALPPACSGRSVTRSPSISAGVLRSWSMPSSRC